MTNISILRVPIKDIVPNRYRNIERYKIDEEKVTALVQSYGNTGFWDGSIQARKLDNGKYEIAFGHHRVEAARRFGMTEVGLIVAQRTDAQMLRMMADENRDEFKHDALVAVETIGAVIEAYGRGEIELETVDRAHPGTQVHTLPGGKVYSLATIARFLGWTKPSDGQATSACRLAFEAYQRSAGIEDALALLPSESRSGVAVQTIVMAANSARKHATDAGLKPSVALKAEKMAAHAAAVDIIENSGFSARERAVSIGRQTVASIVPKKKLEPIPVEFYIRRIERELSELNPTKPIKPVIDKCNELLPVLNDLPTEVRQQLQRQIEETAYRQIRGLLDIARSIGGINHLSSDRLRTLANFLEIEANVIDKK